MTDSRLPAQRDYRQQIAGSLTPVRPLAAPSHRVWMLVPIGILLAASAPLVAGQRGDLAADAPVITWGLSGLQTLLGLWLLALGFRESVPGRNVSRRALTVALVLTAVLVGGITVMTNTTSATVVPPGRGLQFWAECVAWPMLLGTPFMLIATLMAIRAFPTRPSIAGALCGLSAGLLTDAGWRLSCWISEPGHVIASHGLAVIALAVAGAILASVADMPRWNRLRSRT